MMTELYNPVSKMITTPQGFTVCFADIFIIVNVLLYSLLIFLDMTQNSVL